MPPVRHLGAAEPPLDWSFPTELVGSARGLEPGASAVHADAAGNVAAAWVDYAESADVPTLLVRRRSAEGVWGPAETVWSEPRGTIRSIDMTSDARGLLHVVWEAAVVGDANIYHAARDARSGWSRPHTVNDDASGAAQSSPVVSGDLWGSVHIAWVDHRSGTPEIYHARVRHGRGPGRNAAVSGNLRISQTEPALALGSGGVLHAAWIDARSGQARVFVAQLPHASMNPASAASEMVWWPDAGVSSRGALRQSSPVLAAGVGQSMRAVWIDSTKKIRSALLTVESPYWEPDEVIYAAASGTIGRVTVATDLSGQTVVAWDEDSNGDRVVRGGALGEAGTISSVSRIDSSPISFQGRAPQLAVDPVSTVHLVWSGTRIDGTLALFHRTSALPAPNYPEVIHEGWLEYIPGRLSCPNDGYLVASCDGSTGPFTVAGDVDPQFIGRWVRIEGSLIEGTRCPMLVATRIRLGTPVCPATAGAVTGVVTAGGNPVQGATVALGDAEVVTGVSGRFYLPEVPQGRHTMSVSAVCALSAVRESVQVQTGFTAVVPDAVLHRADAQEDCVIDLMDLVRVSLAYHGSPPFHPRCADLDGNGTVDLGDVAAVSGAYGASCPANWTPSTLQDATSNPTDAGPDNNGPLPIGSALVYRGSARPLAWEISVVVDGATESVALLLPRESWTVSRSVTREGELRMAVTRLGARATLANNSIVAWLPNVDPKDVDVTSVGFVGADGQPVPGDLEVTAWGGCAGGGVACRTLWLPAAANLR